MVDLNLTDMELDETFINNFEKTANLYPNKLALKYLNKTLSYSQLNSEANKLACYLRLKYTIAPNELIGVMADRSETMIIGILAILKCGSAFVPIDPDGSTERFNFVCSDTSIKIVLHNILVSALPQNPAVEFVDLNDNKNYQGDGVNLNIPTKLADVAYVMYTSGSTGLPKGVLIKHESLVNFVEGYTKAFKINENDTFIQISNFLFDSCISEIFVPLTCGGNLIIPEKGVQSYPEGILKEIANNKVSILFLTPVMLQLVLDYIASFKIETSNLKCLRRVLTGGETVTLKLTKLFNEVLYQNTGTGLTVVYGPTETTVWVTIWDWPPNQDLQLIPIGKPTENIDIYILDEFNNRLEDGLEGEIVIGGKPVGIGYINRDQLNNEKFLPNPFREGEKMYKTGDKGRILPDGNLEFLGRIDNLVKLNGTRIELNEIENNILKLPKIKECVVLMRLIHDANELVVYFTTKDANYDEKQIIDEIITSLNLVLPSYSIPNFFIKLDAFLINQNGKVDRKNLPLPKGRYFKQDKPFVEPTTNTEYTLTKIIEDILNAEHISIDDVIFNIGVKSILVTKILIQIKKELNTTISVSQFFQFPTIRVLSLFIDNQIVEHPNPFTLLRPGVGEPIFLLPGYLGDQFNFADFVSNFHLNQPLYSIDFSTVVGFDYKSDYMSEFASYLISQIKLIQPKGPYYFIGYSMGGMIGYEIACQLEQSKQKIALLGIVGSTPPYFRDGFYSKFNIFRELNIFLKPDFDVLNKYLKYRISHIFRVVNKRFGRIFPQKALAIDSKNDESIIEEIDANHYKESSLFFKLTFKTSLKFRGDALIIYEDLKSAKYSNFKIEEYYIYHIMQNIWKRFITGNITIHSINCLHEEMVIEPYAGQIAKICEDYLKNQSIEIQK